MKRRKLDETGFLASIIEAGSLILIGGSVIIIALVG